MKITIKIFVLLFVLFIYACDECGECFTPPDFFVFEIVDKTTGENLFLNGTFDSGEIKVVNLSDNSDVDFNFINETNIAFIEVYTIGWQTEKVNYAINIGNTTLFYLYVDAKRIDEDCCSFTRYNEIKIEDVAFEQDATNGIYKILVE